MGNFMVVLIEAARRGLTRTGLVGAVQFRGDVENVAGFINALPPSVKVLAYAQSNVNVPYAIVTLDLSF